MDMDMEHLETCREKLPKHSMVGVMRDVCSARGKQAHREN